MCSENTSEYYRLESEIDSKNSLISSIENVLYPKHDEIGVLENDISVLDSKRDELKSEIDYLECQKNLLQ